MNYIINNSRPKLPFQAYKFFHYGFYKKINKGSINKNFLALIEIKEMQLLLLTEDILFFRILNIV